MLWTVTAKVALTLKAPDEDSALEDGLTIIERVVTLGDESLGAPGVYVIEQDEVTVVPS